MPQLTTARYGNIHFATEDSKSSFPGVSKSWWKHLIRAWCQCLHFVFYHTHILHLVHLSSSGYLVQAEAMSLSRPDRNFQYLSFNMFLLSYSSLGVHYRAHISEFDFDYQACNSICIRSRFNLICYWFIWMCIRYSSSVFPLMEKKHLS